jgi:spore maturation protein CgeB
VGAAAAEMDIAAARAELARLRAEVAALDGELAERGSTRMGLVARIVRAALKDPMRRRTLMRDVGRALVDRMPPRSRRTPMTRGQKGTVRYPLPEFVLPSGPIARPELTVAVILDPFSELALAYEWKQVTFGPDDWRVTLEAKPPELLFVESAWNGNNGRWRLHMTHSTGPSAELEALVAWCRERGVPTVFWNKEDPPNYNRFVETARLFDHVFTVDADRVPEYHQDLGHDRVGLLPFAAQPRIHNPVRRGPGRIYDVAFAGTYFADKHDERRAQMGYVLGPALDAGLHIYSRMQSEDQRYRFPRRFAANIVGSLPYERMLAAYTSYKVFLNVNSVTGSAAMCSRRLFELSAAQTAVVSGPAASIEPFFGDTVAVAHNAEETTRHLTALLRQDEYRERLALRAHRRVFNGHLYADRVDTVLNSVGIAGCRQRPSISVIVPSNRPEQLDNVLAFIGRQNHPDLQLVLVAHGFDPGNDVVARAKEAGIDDVVVRAADTSLSLGACMNFGVDAADATYIAKMDDDNWYGSHFLSDLVRAYSYTDATVVGKWAHFVYHEGSRATLLRFPHAEHRYMTLVQGGTIMVPRDVAADLLFEDLPRRVDTTFLDKVRADGGKIYSTDRFNFVSVRRSDPSSHTWKITEADMLAGQAQLVFYGEPFDHADV